MSVCPDCGVETDGKRKIKLCPDCLRNRKRLSNFKSRNQKKRLNLKGKSFDEVRELIGKKYRRKNR